ncbi:MULTISPECIES: PhoH family protein [Geomicrobium]|uniref:PhoH family protein n=1 Tax=Geomicrobium TaxID=767528 RepID=UPI00045F2977|nr:MULTISPECIES: PhoH family protein [Geomicrobium]GAK07380.1 predicted ATPase related to phosphate starvation-inducible protein PhoH [Geomicrobium sp. JCM 19038]
MPGGNRLKNIYVLDTNVLLQDPYALFSFKPHDVVIPAVVLEELDAKKKNMDELGKNAREVARILDKLREEGPLHKGIKVGSDCFVRVELNHSSYKTVGVTLPDVTNDNRLIAVALNLNVEQQAAEQARKVIVVSKDALVRIKSEAFGLTAEDFLYDRVVVNDELYKGYRRLEVDGTVLESFYGNQTLPVHELKCGELEPNTFLVLKNRLQPSVSGLAKVNHSATHIEPLRYEREHIWGVKPRNVQQKMAIELLLDPQLPLVTLAGKAGTGKTLLSIAAGLYQAEDLGRYKKLLVARPVVPLGKDIGYLPGEKEEKLRPWMQPIYDNLEYLFNTNKPEELDHILAGMGGIQVEALTYIRGRSLPNQFIIIDEAQNLTKHEAKTILTRVGENSKVVLVGDPEQIDHPYLDAYNNGLTYVIERFKNVSISGHTALEKGERSALAQLAADLL